ncbi:MAG: glucose-6-phosphate isomerase [Lactobacillaceae bacterium]|jgi:glucose-6-phosphate isomerase|nr:glucose-6-phosphate isomerase [Lactobacillaceae bacterium]
MTNLVTFDNQFLKKFINDEEYDNFQSTAQNAVEQLIDGSGAGGTETKWLNLPNDYDAEEFTRIQSVAKKIQNDSEVLIVIGIGGSYLGARAVIEYINGTNYNLTANRDGLPEIYFVGNTTSAAYQQEIINIIGDRDFSINVISKSGTTTEPAIAFRFFKKLAEQKYGDQAKDKIYVTTDSQKGALKEVAAKNDYETFVVPDRVGGRYSVLSAVGLLPISVSGIDIDKLYAGARLALGDFNVESDSVKYAITRNILYRQGFNIELFNGYEPRFQYIFEWLKQLFAESEGKNNRGIFPTAAIFTTDLHSIGQFIQEGRKIIFETVLNIKKSSMDEIIPSGDNVDQLAYLEGKNLSFITNGAMIGTINAHISAGVPNIKLDIEDDEARTLGYLIHFFETSAAISGYLNAINPFNQNGVEVYKTNMFKILGKPGY